MPKIKSTPGLDITAMKIKAEKIHWVPMSCTCYLLICTFTPKTLIPIKNLVAFTLYFSNRVFNKGTSKHVTNVHRIEGKLWEQHCTTKRKCMIDSFIGNIYIYKICLHSWILIWISMVSWWYTCSTLDLWLGLQSILHNTGNVKREFQAKLSATPKLVTCWSDLPT